MPQLRQKLPFTSARSSFWLACYSIAPRIPPGRDVWSFSVAWSLGRLENARSHNRKRVCIHCTDQGYSPKDIAKYSCDECGEKGHTKFKKQLLYKHKQSQGLHKIICNDCVARQTNIEKHCGRKLHGNANAQGKGNIFLTMQNAICSLKRWARSAGLARTTTSVKTT